jgi:hypothetical protein
MPPHIIRHADMIAAGACGSGLVLHNTVARAQGNDNLDTVHPDGWTPLHTAMLYVWHPRFLIWLEKHKLVPLHELPDIGIKRRLRLTPPSIIPIVSP